MKPHVRAATPRFVVSIALLFSLLCALILPTPTLAESIFLPLITGSQSADQRVQAAAATELFLSEYIEGSSFNKAIEIYNGTGAAVDLAAGVYRLELYSNGAATASQSVALTGSLADGEVYVLANASADALILAQTDLTSNAVINFNGDDAVALRKNGVLIDVIGQIGFDPGSEWGTGLASTADNTIRRKSTVCSGDTNGADAFAPAGEWDGFANNSFDGLGAHTAACGTSGDVAPTVASTTPATNATDLAVTSNIDITFSEAVTVVEPWFTITCTSGSRTATVTGGPTTFTLDPASDFAAGESCTVSVVAANVTDLDADDPPDAMAADYSFSFTTVADTSLVTPISTIQGSGSVATAGTFTIEAIVVGDYQTQGSGQLRGFFVQEEDSDADADPATSEAIFVFCTTCPTPVTVGDKVRVTGTSSEFFNMSQLNAATAASVTVLTAGNPLPTPATIQLPVPGVPSGDLAAATAVINAYFEPFEGMLVTFPATLAVSEYFELARYGQVILSAGGRPRTFTAANSPSAAGLINHEIDLARRTLILDDTDNRQNRPSDAPNTAYYHPVPGLSTGNFFRGGDTITNLTGVLHWSFAGQSGTDAWRIRPVTEAYSYAFTSVNARPAAPSLAGSLKVASFNVLNYFLTIDTTSGDTGPCGGASNLDCRGADSAQELERQRAKLTQALLGLDADIVGMIEMENTPGVTPPQQIVADLNAIAGAGTYAFIDTGVIGTDAIRLGLLYQPGKVTPVGNYAILDSTVDPTFIDTRNRPALAQTFAEVANNARFTVVVNHLKSKGSGCGAGDDDTTTGQGNCNGTRTLAAQALASWLAGDPTNSGDPDVLIIGDLNSYAKEDPIVALQSTGYTDLVAAFGGPEAYSYVFDGQLGYLDHALANASLTPQVAAVTEWHINADELPLFDYNDDVRDAGEAAFEEESAVFPLYAADAFRTSDHDPVLIGLDLDGVAPFVTVTGVSAGATYPLGNVPSAGCDTQDAQSGVATAATLTVTGGDSNGLGSFTATCSGAVDNAGNSADAVSVTYMVVPAGTPVDSCGGYTVYKNGTVYSAPGWSGNIRVGTSGNNTILGMSGADLILGLGGNDLLTGNDGDDLICGGDGVDLLFGLAGNDLLDGGAGNDVLNGGSGDHDQLIGDVGNDTLLDGDGVLKAEGGVGNDLFTIVLRNGWRDSAGAAAFTGLAAGYGNDTVGLAILGSTTFLLDITGDERDDPASAQEGNNDKLALVAAVDPASTIIKFERRLTISAAEQAIPADDDGAAYLTEAVGEAGIGGLNNRFFLPLVIR